MANSFANLANRLVAEIDRELAAIGPRLRLLRQERGRTLADLATETGVSISTLSRLEGGERRPTLELLLPIARAYRITLDELVDVPATADPRVPGRAVSRDGITMLPLSRHAGAIQAYKLVISPRRKQPEARTHEGYEWLYVLDGRLRLILGDQHFVLSVGEAAEFDTRVPHSFGSADGHPVELLSLFGRHGERAHLRAAQKRT